MADQNEPMWRAPEPDAQAIADPSEFVLRGLIFALAALVAGSVIAVVLWDLHLTASISSFVIALGAFYLYVKGSGTMPRKGLVPLLLLILLGVVASFFAVVANDLWRLWAANPDLEYQPQMTFVLDNVFNPSLLKFYSHDALWFFLLAALGIFGVFRRLIGRR